MIRKSKTKLKKQGSRKTNSVLSETLKEAIKYEEWIKVAGMLSGPTRRYKSINLDEIDQRTTTGDRVVIVGKVLGKGELSKKVRICALSFSAKVKERIKNSKSEIVSIIEEIKKNPKAEGIKIL